MNDIWSERQLTKLVQRKDDHRSPFQRDRARILHSAAFRRLQSKTQVMGSGQSDFYRTRLTHSLEAAQIGSGISAQLRNKYPELSAALFPNDDTLIESLCLAHDIGHPPFGHGGEVALNFMMRNHGGFEGNGQTFRIVSYLEPFSEHHGMNLARRTLLGLVKYPQTLDQLSNNKSPTIPDNFRQLKAADWHPAKGLFQDDINTLNWLLAPLSDADRQLFQQSQQQENAHSKTLYKSLDCSIMELADDIAYGIHDLEDAIVTGVVQQADFEQYVIAPLTELDDSWLQQLTQELSAQLFSQKTYQQKEAIGGLVNYLITAIVLVDLNKKLQLTFNEPLLRYNAKHPPNACKVLQIFKRFVFDFVIKRTEIQHHEYRGQQIVMELFEALASDPQRLLPKNALHAYKQAETNGLNSYRVIADYVAGMTDDFATHLYQSLFIPSNTLSRHDLHG
ncbi:deoxyguanosinetriphosphate triphosphohydrolase-like protein [Thalassotalea insulae]|uniref:Deoxyguanosinetriphosphate triphosphohydrolase-like protein n=1 Tax=Thalassotalea insulae TaxID=2056778 RepID=A0ABQ6GRE2_9GAMM|nr:anti-phage deoxyguanosine triphosphatase [Thalassotalea insulae]GLX77251.1 deoxyguanosinetriphosphate triphosphohydrolase-like protein [Thalassotalea insulae]